MLLYYFIIREKRNNFTGWTMFLTRLFISLVDICFYYFAAKVFTPSNLYDVKFDSLFLFATTGQLMMAVGLDALVSAQRNIRLMAGDGTFNLFLISPKPFWKILLLSQASTLMATFLMVIVDLLILKYLFKIPFTFLSFSLTFFVQLLFLPMLLAFGNIAASALIVMKRGTTAFGSIISIIGMVSGVYFPVTAYPETFSSVIKILSPYYHLLQITRDILDYGRLSSEALALSLSFCAAGVGLYFISISCLNWSIKKHKKDKNPLIFTQ